MPSNNIIWIQLTSWGVRWRGGRWQFSNINIGVRSPQKSLQYLGDDGEVGEVGEYFGDDGDIWAGAVIKCQETRRFQMY